MYIYIYIYIDIYIYIYIYISLLCISNKGIISWLIEFTSKQQHDSDTHCNLSAVDNIKLNIKYSLPKSYVLMENTVKY